jgi:hypothetical protein
MDTNKPKVKPDLPRQPGAALVGGGTRAEGGGEVVVGVGHVGLAVAAVEGGDEVLGVEVGGERGAGAEVVLPELEGLAVEADADQALADGEGDAAVGVEPGVLLVLAEDGELGAVDRAQLGERQAQLERSESVDLDQSPATLECVADGRARATTLMSAPSATETGVTSVDDHPVMSGPPERPNSLVPEVRRSAS